MSGALRLATRAAFAAGAGLVHAVAPRDTIAALIQAEPDLQTMAHSFDEKPSRSLLDLIASAGCVVVGPGLGRSPGRRAFVTAIVAAASSTVLDADALVAFAGAAEELAPLAAARHLVLTPHPGEFRTLFPALAAARELDPWGAASMAANDIGATILLKGVPTVVAAPERRLLTVVAGNPGLATGGSGDVLSGLVAAQLTTTLAPEIAAALGAQILGRAADIAARRHTARSMRPMDVIHALPDVWREWEVLGSGNLASRPPLLFELPRPHTT
jgi:NAD(P)H-hydrate epimerase